MNQALYLVLKRCTSCLQKLGLLRTQAPKQLQFKSLCEMAMRAHSAEDKPQGSQQHHQHWQSFCPTKWVGVPRHQCRDLPVTAGSRQSCICPASSLRSLSWEHRPGTSLSESEATVKSPEEMAPTGFQKHQLCHSNSYLPSTHINPIVFLSNNKKIELGLGGDQIWTQSSFLISLLAKYV